MRKEKSVSQNKSNIPDIDVIDLDNDILEDDKGLLNEELPAEKFSVRTLFKKRKHLIPDLLWMALAAFTSLIIVFFVYKMWKRDITCPIVYYQDGVGGLLSIKNISDGNGFFHFPSLRAPYGEYNYNQDYILPLIIISIFSIFTKSVGALSNLFWLSTYFFTACTAYAFLRRIHCQHIIAFMGAIIYNFLPYHYFRIEHFWLFGCYIIPLIGWIIIDILDGSIYNDIYRIRIGRLSINKVLLLDLLFCILIGLNGLYYSYFAVLLFVFSGVISAIEHRQLKQLWKIALYSGIVFFIVLYYMVVLGYLNDGGRALANLSTTRGVADVHTYSLDIFLLFLPIPGHRIETLSQFTQSCYELFNIHTENYQAVLGLVMSIGFLVSVFFAFLNRRKKGELMLIRQMGILNIFIIMVSCIGGFGTFVSLFISSAIRCYNRTSVIIALFSVAAICLGLNYLYRRFNIPIAFRILICMFICIIGIFDQTSSCFADYSTYNALTLCYSGNRDEMEQRYKEDMEFVKNIEIQMGENKNIYFLPNELQYSSDRVSFAKTKGYICGTSSNWSATILDSQYSNALTLIENTEFNTFVTGISLLGFNGVVIDKNSFSQDVSYYNCIENFEEELGLQPYYNITADLCFFDISDIAQNICSNYSAEYIENVRNYFCNGITTNRFISIGLNQLQTGDALNNISAVTLSKGESVCGPYISLDPGYYQITILGKQLNNCEVVLSVDQGSETLDFRYTALTDDVITCEFYLDDTRDGISFTLSSSKNSTVLNSIVMQLSEDGNFISYEDYLKNIDLKRTFFCTFKVDLTNFYIGGVPQNRESFTIPQNTMQYGPYIKVDPGNYRVTITGNNLSDADIQLVTEGGKKNIDMQNVAVNDSQITFEFTTFTTITNLEVYLSNVNHEMQILEYVFEIMD